MALAVLTENIRIGGFDKAHHLPNFKAWPERAKRGIDGNLWSRGTATMSYPFDACEEGLPCSVDVLPGRASAIHATRGDGIGRLGGASSKPLWQGAQHSRSSCSSRHVPWSTGKHDNKDGASLLSCFIFLSTCSKDSGANAAFSDVRRVTEPAPSQDGNVNLRRVSQCWQLTKENPLPRKKRLDESEEVNDSKRSPLIEEGLSDGHRVNRLVLGNREVHSGY